MMNEMQNEKTSSQIHSGHRERIRQKIITTGVDHMAPHEVLEYLLFFCIPRRDTNEYAHKLIDAFGSIAGVLEADIKDLVKVDGISMATATFLTSIPHISRYYFKDRWSAKIIFKDNIELGNYLCDLFAGEKNEVFYLLSFDAQNGLINKDLIDRGIINQTATYPRMMAERALKNNAATVVLAHNHPGGSVTASEEDVALTKTLVELFSTLSIRVLDHVIISGNRFSSMKNKGFVQVRTEFTARENDEELNGDWNFD